MTRTCLVSVFHPGNILAAMAAVKWYGIVKKKDNVNTDIYCVIHVPGMQDRDYQDLERIIGRLISSQGWKKPICISDKDLMTITSHKKYTLTLEKYRRFIGIEHIDEFFYAHDVLGLIPELSMNAYPTAERITFGDALGSVYNKNFHLSLASGTRLKSRIANIVRILSAVLKFFRKLLWGGPVSLQAETALLILPMDQTGDYLSDKELQVIPRQFVLEIVDNITQILPELVEFVNDLIVQQQGPHYLLLLENISDGNFMSEDNEVALYREVVYNSVPKKATIIIKPHPLSRAGLLNRVNNVLKTDYNPIIFPEHLTKYPIEIFKDLIEKTEIISFSYPSISLTYLYGKKVIYPLNTALIEKYIYPEYWESYKNSDAMYSGQIRNLAEWDGKSVLWSGESR